MSVSDQANLSPAERARLVRHGAVVERASNLLGNDATKMSTFRAHISSYKSGTMTAAQLIDAFFSLFGDTSASALGTLVREVADLFEDKSKADALHKAWQDWRAINEDYPSLPGLGGMHGATTSSSGWAGAAASGPTLHPGTGAGAGTRERHTTRVLKLKNSTQARRGSGGASVPGSAPAATTAPSSVQWSGQSRAPAASSSAAFPALPSSSKPSAGKSAPLWIGGTQPAVSAAAGSSTSSARASGSSTPVRRTGGGGGPAPATSSRDAFPALPAAPKVQTTIFGYGNGRSVRRDFGQAPSNFSWTGGQSSGAAGAGGGGGGGGEEAEAEGAGGGGKGKKKGKKVLVAWG